MSIRCTINQDSYFVPRFNGYYHFITESAIGLHDLLKQKAKLDSLDCHLWYQGTFGEIVQLFSRYPIVNIPNQEPFLREGCSIHPDIETLKHVELTRDVFWKLADLAQFLSQRIPTVDAACGITLVKRTKIREYAESELLLQRLERFKLPIKIVQLEKMSFAAQVNAMRSTRILIAPHGAGTINQMFMPPGGRIIELFPKGYSNWQQKIIADVFNHELVEIESENPGIYGRPPSDEMRSFLDRHKWPNCSKMQSLAVSSQEAHSLLNNRKFTRVLRDVGSFSIDPEIICEIIEGMLTSTDSANSTPLASRQNFH